MSEIELLLLLIATIAGSLTSWLLGWGDAGGGDFDWNKAWPSMIRMIIAAVAVFLASYFEILGPITLITYLGAYMAGLAIDAGGNRLAGVIRS